ncbi:MAG TPA: hypothetical protein VFA04_09240 [Bryobacteraceae bacterium]|nr:hypothetical protein [Bryobacteraceae bacterium]
MPYLTADELLAGSSAHHDIEIPPALLGRENGASRRVRLRPLTVRDVQLVTRAAKDSDALLSALMLKEALVEPALSFDQVQALPGGVARFLVEELNRISGLQVDKPGLAEAVQAPMAKACFLLAREFGWSPQQVGELTLGQVLLYLEMIREHRKDAAGA